MYGKWDSDYRRTTQWRGQGHGSYGWDERGRGSTYGRNDRRRSKTPRHQHAWSYGSYDRWPPAYGNRGQSQDRWRDYNGARPEGPTDELAVERLRAHRTTKKRSYALANAQRREGDVEAEVVAAQATLDAAKARCLTARADTKARSAAFDEAEETEKGIDMKIEQRAETRDDGDDDYERPWDDMDVGPPTGSQGSLEAVFEKFANDDTPALRELRAAFSAQERQGKASPQLASQTQPDSDKDVASMTATDADHGGLLSALHVARQQTDPQAMATMLADAIDKFTPSVGAATESGADTAGKGTGKARTEGSAPTPYTKK